jgi:hypothetical protein
MLKRTSKAFPKIAYFLEGDRFPWKITQLSREQRLIT